jgi:hypothetical protein
MASQTPHLAAQELLMGCLYCSRQPLPPLQAPAALQRTRYSPSTECNRSTPCCNASWQNLAS